MSTDNTDWWERLYSNDTTPDTTTDTPRHLDTAGHDTKTRQDTTPDRERHVGRVLTLHRPAEGPRPISDLLLPAEQEDKAPDTKHGTKTDKDTTPNTGSDTDTDTAKPPTEDKNTEQEETPDTEDTQAPKKSLYARIGGTFDRLNDDHEAPPKKPYARPAYEPTEAPKSPKKALVDAWASVPTRYRWPLYHLGAAAAGEALALTPWIDTGLVSYARDGASIVAELGWSDTWSWWGTALAAAGLYAWSRHKHPIIAWTCTIPLASAVVGALLYTPNI